MNVKNRKRAPIWVHLLHEVQQRIRSVRKREKLAEMLSLIRRKNYLDKAENSKVLDLKVNGYLLLEGLLSKSEIEILIKKLKKKKCKDRARRELDFFAYDSKPPLTHVADINDVVDIPEAIKLANDPQVLSLVESYLGAEPFIDSIKAWWSYPGFDEAENEQFYHRDNDSIKFVKLFMYLTDVDEDTGPHVFIKGSQKDDTFYERRRFSDKEIETYYPADRKVEYTGLSGTAFLEDTYGLHKGTLPKVGKRLVIQIRYSLVPTIFLNRTMTTNPKCLQYMKSDYINRYIKG